MKNLFFTVLLGVTLVSCGENGGVAPGSASVDCDISVAGNMTANAFELLLQNGASETEPYVICIPAGVSVNSPVSGNIDISSTNLLIVGESSSTSSLTNVVLGNGSSVAFSNLKLNGVGEPAINSPIGNGEFVSTSVTDSVVESNRSGIRLTPGDAGQVTLAVSDSTITSVESGVVTTAGHAGTVTASIEQVTIITGDRAIHASSGNAGQLNFDLGANVYRSSGTGGSATNSMNFSVGDAGQITLDSTSSTRSTACNVAGSTDTFTQVYGTSTGAAGSVGGSFSIANMTNTNNTTIGTCP